MEDHRVEEDGGEDERKGWATCPDDERAPHHSIPTCL